VDKRNFSPATQEFISVTNLRPEQQEMEDDYLGIRREDTKFDS